MYTIREGNRTLTPDDGYDVAIYQGDQTGKTNFNGLSSVRPKESVFIQLYLLERILIQEL